MKRNKSILTIGAFVFAMGAAFAFKSPASHTMPPDNKNVYTKVGTGSCSTNTTSCSNDATKPICVNGATFYLTSGCSDQTLSYTHQPV
jgi:hypothetical protein